MQLILRKAKDCLKIMRASFSAYQRNDKMMADGNVPGMPLEVIVKALNHIAPISLAEKWDNTGLLIEPPSLRLVTKVLLTNDLTEDVMEEASELDVEMIISYHPPIFAPLKCITQRTWKERIVGKLLEQRIALYSPHTSWDAIEGGVNDWLASCLPSHQRQPIVEGTSPNIGSGRICQLEHSTSLENIVSSVKNLTGLSNIRLAKARGVSMSAPIKCVALCAGSGSSVLKGVQADLFLTGEMLHHDVLDAVHCGTSVILTNHSDSERGFLTQFQPKLEKILENQVMVVVSSKDEDPLKTV